MKKSNIVVLKFGGTSMGSAITMNSCTDVIKERLASKKKPFVVVSAISKMTDTLLNLLSLAKNRKKQELNRVFQSTKDRHFEILKDLTKNEELINKYTKILNAKFASLLEILSGILLTCDYSEKMQANVLSYGEDLSSDLVELCLLENGIKTKKINSKFLVKTHGDYLSTTVDFIKTKKAFKKVLPEINNGTVFIMTGFFGGGKNNEIMLLGRGGSDFSGSISGIALDSDIVEIWTDADGVMSADPRLITNAISWEKLNKDIASEMARSGAKVLHPKTICASYYDIDIIIRNLFNKNFKGTLVNSDFCEDGVKGVVADGDYSILHLENQDMFGGVGFIAKLGIIADDYDVPLDMAATSETSVSFTIKSSCLNKEILKSFNSIADFSIINDVVKISVIGQNISNNSILEKIFSALKLKNIEPLMITMGQSKNNIGIIVKKDNKNLALSGIYEILFMN